MPNINDLNAAWIAAGQKVADLNAKLNTAVLDDNFTAESFENLKKNRDNEVARRDALHSQLETARAESKPAQEIIHDKKEENKSFVNNFRGMLKNDPKVVNMLSSKKDEKGNGIGLTIDGDVETQINTIKRTFTSLEQFVSIENVSTPAGTRVIEVDQDITPLANLDDESATIGDNDDPTLTIIKYAIKRYAGISSATNTLLADSDENVIAWLTGWVAKKDVVTRNSAILAVLKTLPEEQQVKVSSFDDLKTILNTKIDPLIAATSVMITNQSGFDVMDHVVDNNGRYVMQRDVTNPTAPAKFDGKPVIVISDRFLPNDGETHPLYVGDLKQAVHLFDRQQMSLLTTNIGAGAFEQDLTKIRAIDRFDVQLWDTAAVVYAPFTSLADLTPKSTAPTATKAKTTK